MDATNTSQETTKTTTDKMQIANTISDQIGRRALFMLGAKNLLATEQGLQFRIGRNANGVSHVVVNLDASDTYTVEFRSIRMSRKSPGGISNKLKKSFEGVYADSLHTVLESGTGMYTSL